MPSFKIFPAVPNLVEVGQYYQLSLDFLAAGRMGPNSLQWCPATGQGAMGINIGSSTLT